MTMVIGQLCTQCARRYPDRKAVVFKGKSKTFAEFNSRVNKLADAICKMGVVKGDNIALLSRNNAEVLEVLFAVAKSGATYVPINFRLVPDELRYVINDAGIKMLFVTQDFADSIELIKKDISVPHIFSMENDYEGLVASGADVEPDVAVKPEDLFAIFYTSGTTGGPKGVMLTHDNFLSAAINTLISYRLGPYDVALHVMPLYHTMEASIVMCQFCVGGTNVITDAFNADEFWKFVHEDGVTHITLVYTMLLEIIDMYKKKGLTKGPFKYFSIGGQTTPVPILQEALRTFGRGSIFVVYGLTEASPLLTSIAPEDMVLEGPGAGRVGSIGKEMMTSHVRVVDDNDNDVKPSELGELIARGPGVMQGYWNRPKETAEALKGGWLRTGDVGTVDEDGYIYVVDRKKDLVISGGENIAPHEVEDVIYKYPGVKECSVIGVPDEKWGEKVKAIVVMNDGIKATEEEIIKFTTERLAKYKCPRSVAFIESLPKDPVGKVQKRILREMFKK